MDMSRHGAVRHLRSLGHAVVAAGVLVGCSSGGTAAAQSACSDLGGTVESDQICHLHAATSSYTYDVRFPQDYPDQQALTGFLTQDRDEFVDWVAQFGQTGRGRPYEYESQGTPYRSGQQAPTQSLVFKIQEDTGLSHEGHPNTRFKAFNYDLSKGVAITFDTLFKPGAKPLEVLNPIVQRKLTQPGVQFNDLDVTAYQNFAITDDAVTFFFGENQVISDNNGPHQVSVPRAELASILA